MAKQKKEVEVLTPVNILWENVLMVSIYGTLDSKRAQQVMEAMLARIMETESKTIILDILAVGTVDSAVAAHLVKMTRATTLMGCECIISGISPAIAQTMVQLGVELRDIRTTATLRDALSLAFGMIGLKVVEKK